MGRQITVTLGGAAGTADLFDEAAPKTAEAVWQALPIRSTIFHANFSGEEVAFSTFGLLWEKENQLYQTQPGDLGYFLVGPSICLYYGAVRTISPGNVFGRIKTNLPRIQDIARRSWRESGISITLERKEG